MAADEAVGLSTKPPVSDFGEQHTIHLRAGSNAVRGDFEKMDARIEPESFVKVKTWIVIWVRSLIFRAGLFLLTD